MRSRLFSLLICLLYGCVDNTIYQALRTKNYNEDYRFIVDRYGYHYYRGPYAPDRFYVPMYYNNSGYFNTVDECTGKEFYYNAYDNYNQGYYGRGFYNNEYYFHGYFNGYYNPGDCRGGRCIPKGSK